MKVGFYRTLGGRSPVEDFIRALPEDRAEEILAAIKDIVLHGLADAEVTMRHIDGKLWEMKFSTDRVFYVVLSGPEMVLLHGYKKQSQKAPPREIETAHKRMKELLGG